ncbi:MAG: DNA-processing protein DprA [Ruminococcus sp.]|nr:DNA-processing protein DprA [Ruminococcus sp.]
MDEKRYWVWLTMIFGAGSRRVWEAMNLFQSAQEAYEQLSGGETALNMTDRELRNLRGTDISDAEKLMERCSDKGIGVVCYTDADYPAPLRYITNPPAVLYYKGDIGCLGAEMSVTSVGARKAGEYGLRATREICRGLAQNGVLIVSGFALGVDITSHLAAAEVGSPTACVLGCGLDIDYPKENIKHRQAILDAGGAFISEYPPGTSPFAGNFPKRNRILAALGRAAVIFEATINSGSLITANIAAEQGREIFCLPPSDIFDEAFSGNIAVLRSGAVPLYGVEDIFDYFGIASAPGSGEEVRISAFAEELNVPEKKKPPKKSAGRSARAAAEKKLTDKREEPAAKAVPEGLAGLQRDIAELLAGGALHADEIAARLGTGQTELMTELTELEILGIVRQQAGKMFELC